MPDVNSRHFNGIQLRALERIGDIYLPAYEELPAFSESGCIENIDVLLDEIHPEDLFALSVLLYVIRFAPLFLLNTLVQKMNHHDQYPELFAAPLRLLSLALKGVVMSLYYSGATGNNYKGRKPFEVMGYELHCEPDGNP